MPFALVVIGLIMIVTGVQNTYSQFASQAASDSKLFIKWMIAIGSVGALGYVQDLRQFSHYFMALILVSMVLANKGLFQNFQAAISNGPVAPKAGDNSSSTASTASTASTPGLPAGSSASMQGLFGQSPGTPGQTGTYGQAKANQYFNAILGLFTGTGQ